MPADLNLIRVFSSLMQQRSVTGAARELGLGQPAVSHALSRLRVLYGDELFVRSGAQMQPTARAVALSQTIEPALSAIVSTLLPQSIDLATATPTLRVALVDGLELSLLPPLLRMVRATIPNARMIVKSTDDKHRQHTTAFARSPNYTSLTYAGPSADLQLNASRVCVFGYRVLRADLSPRRLTLADYQARPHVKLRSEANTLRQALEVAQIKRNVVLLAPHLFALPNLLESSDLLATVPTFAVSALDIGHLRDEPTPFPAQSEVWMHWRRSAEHDPPQVWLRKSLLQLTKKLFSPVGT